MAVHGWLEAPADISIKGWEYRGLKGGLSRGPSLNKAKIAVEAGVAEALADTARAVSEKKHVGFPMAPNMSRVFFKFA